MQNWNTVSTKWIKFTDDMFTLIINAAKQVKVINSWIDNWTDALITQVGEDTVSRFLPYYIIIAFALNQPEIAEMLKTAMIKKLNISVEDLKIYAKRILADEERAAELEELTNKYLEYI